VFIVSYCVFENLNVNLVRYPINTLRNLAVNTSKTDLIMVVDIDFIPSANFWEYCVSADIFNHLALYSANKRVWALVSLELHEDYLQLPRDRTTLSDCLKNKSVVVAEAYLNPAAHAPVQVEDWLSTEEVRSCSGNSVKSSNIEMAD
jgi:hypothetical protein